MTQNTLLKEVSRPAPALNFRAVFQARILVLQRRPLIIFVFLLVFVGSASSIEQPKTRIISLTPASTEILFALGLDREIIGVSSFCNWPEEAQHKEKVGSFSSPNIEKIITLKPDLAVITGMEQEHLKNILSKLGRIL